MERDEFLEKSSANSKYTLFIDESGDPSASKGTDNFVLGGFLIYNERYEYYQNVLQKLSDELGVSFPLHFKELRNKRREKVFDKITKELGGLGLAYSVVSKKSTLNQPRFEMLKQEFEQDEYKFYHKCCQYLLEQVCLDLISFNLDPSDLQIVFETRDANSSSIKDAYLTFGKYMHQVIANPIGSKYQIDCIKLLASLNCEAIFDFRKNELSSLAYADLVSYCTYRVFNKDVPRLSERSDLIMRAAPLFTSKKGNHLRRSKPIKPIHSWNDVGLCPELSMRLRNRGLIV